MNLSYFQHLLSQSCSDNFYFESFLYHLECFFFALKDSILLRHNLADQVIFILGQLDALFFCHSNILLRYLLWCSIISHLYFHGTFAVCCCYCSQDCNIIVFLNMTLYTYKLINTNTIYTKLTLM